MQTEFLALLLHGKKRPVVVPDRGRNAGEAKKQRGCAEKGKLKKE